MTTRDLLLNRSQNGTLFVTVINSLLSFIFFLCRKNAALATSLSLMIHVMETVSDSPVLQIRTPMFGTDVRVGFFPADL